MEDAIEALADHVIETKLEDIPSSAIRAAKTYILDTIGVGLAGSIGPYVEELVSTFGNSVIDPENSARVIGQNIRLSPGKAALLNGFQIHNSEFDCVHEEAVVHTMTVLLATLLADADKRGGVTGETLMRASVLGVDVACNLGVAASSALQFFRPATAGAFAAVAAVACARGFDKDRLLRAFSLAYIQLSGTMQAHTEGSSLLALQIGFNAQNALAACDLADNGLPGLKGILEGRFGYFGLIEAAGDIHSVLSTLKQNWRINEVAHKPFPSGRATHGIVDAIRELQMH
ncbi:MAG: MmgE/PrpD family protein, partial [Pseudomonadota bacterium]|nr:MmgE/PrpD family protein [Pseudomonadota bacterium]